MVRNFLIVDYNTKKKLVSVIIPTYRSEQFLGNTLDCISSHLKTAPFAYEIVVDDGRDAIWDLVRHYGTEDERIQPFWLRRNQGQHIAQRTGIIRARGSILVFIDDDLEQDPLYIQSMVDIVLRGMDVVNGARPDRISGQWQRRLIRWLINRLLGLGFRNGLADPTSPFKVIKADVLRNLPGMVLLPEYALFRATRISEVMGQGQKQNQASRYNRSKRLGRIMTTH